MITELIVAGVLSLFLGFSLAFASKKFSVKFDEKIERIVDVLPNNNCGVCGFANCLEFAKAVEKDPMIASHCKVGGKRTVDEISKILDVTPHYDDPRKAVVMCSGASNDKYEYEGVRSCKASLSLHNSPKACSFSCIGFGDCIKVCNFGSLHFGEYKVPQSNEKCVACGLCVASCPKGLIKLLGKGAKVAVACSSNDNPETVAKNCNTGCIACGLCVKKCPKSAIQIKDNLAVIDYSSCIGCQLCAETCPRNVILKF